MITGDLPQQIIRRLVRRWSTFFVRSDVRYRENLRLLSMTGDSPVEIDPFNKVLAYEVANYFNTLGWYQLLTGEFANCEKLVRRGVIPAERQQDAEAILSLLEKP